jgi:hypothetical protein
MPGPEWEKWIFLAGVPSYAELTLTHRQGLLASVRQRGEG